jgi:hypothetical protein
MALDGFTAGPEQSPENPFEICGMQVSAETTGGTPRRR